MACIYYMCHVVASVTFVARAILVVGLRGLHCICHGVASVTFVACEEEKKVLLWFPSGGTAIATMSSEAFSRTWRLRGVGGKVAYKRIAQMWQRRVYDAQDTALAFYSALHTYYTHVYICAYMPICAACCLLAQAKEDDEKVPEAETWLQNFR